MHWKYHIEASHPHPVKNINVDKAIISNLACVNCITLIEFNLQGQDSQWKGLLQHPSFFYLGMPKKNKTKTQQ